MTVVHTVIVEFADIDEARAMRDIIADLGYNPTLTSRTIEITASPMRDTRLGRLVLRNMMAKRSYTLEEISEVLVCNEYAPTSAGVVLSKLTNEGDITRINHGRYVKK